MRPRSERDLLTGLRILLRSNDTAALQEHLRIHADELGRMAGVTTASIEKRAAGEHPRRAAEKLLELARARERGQSSLEAQRRVYDAAARLVSTARWTEGEAHLDVSVLLGELLAPQGSHLVFQLNGHEVVVRRRDLMGLCRLRRRLVGLSAHLTPDALVFTWRGGRGSLRLRCRTALPRDLDGSPRIVFERPAPVVSERGIWLRSALTSVLEQLGAQ